jgi:SSS family solute:Na+ symporter
MYGLGFYSKHTTERGLLIGVVVGFDAVWYTAATTQVAWPWYCAIGGGVNIAVSLVASLVLDGRQAEWSEYSVPGQQRRFRAQGLSEKDGGWYVVPGKVDRVCYALLAFFAFTVVFLAVFQAVV